MKRSQKPKSRSSRKRTITETGWAVWNIYTDRLKTILHNRRKDAWENFIDIYPFFHNDKQLRYRGYRCLRTTVNGGVVSDRNVFVVHAPQERTFGGICRMNELDKAAEAYEAMLGITGGRGDEYDTIHILDAYRAGFEKAIAVVAKDIKDDLFCPECALSEKTCRESIVDELKAFTGLDHDKGEK